LALGYSATSATLSVANKWALVGFPYSGTLTLAQFGFAALSVRALAWCGLVEAETLELGIAMRFSPAVVMFYASISCNMRLLSHGTVDTFVVCRSVVPVVTELGEVCLLGKPVPSSQALLCLLLVAAGASGYAARDAAALEPAVLAWAALYVLCISADMLVVKRVVSTVELSSWGYVYYNNALALLLYPAWLALSGEASTLRAAAPGLSLAVLAPVLLSCAIGLAISFFGLNARRALSATAFTVLGAACKFLSVLINTLAWSRHAPLAALPWLCVSLAGSVLYQQAALIDPASRLPRRPGRRWSLAQPGKPGPRHPPPRLSALAHPPDLA